MTCYCVPQGTMQSGILYPCSCTGNEHQQEWFQSGGCDLANAVAYIAPSGSVTVSQWSTWSQWSSCSAQCQQSRTRTCSDGTNQLPTGCPESDTETIQCNTDACTGNKQHMERSLRYTPFTISIQVDNSS